MENELKLQKRFNTMMSLTPIPISFKVGNVIGSWIGERHTK